MSIIKLLWFIRAIIYKITFKQIGFMTYIGKPCFLKGRNRIKIGNRTRIFPGLRIEALGKGEIVIGDNCAIEQNVHIISMKGNLVIGNNSTISSNVFISNVDHEYKDINKSVMDQSLIYRDTSIGEGCFIGFGSAILPGSHLGDHCIVGSNSIVKGDYPDGTVIAGNPAKVLKIYDKEKKTWRRVS